MAKQSEMYSSTPAIYEADLLSGYRRLLEAHRAPNPISHIETWYDGGDRWVMDIPKDLDEWT